MAAAEIKNRLASARANIDAIKKDPALRAKKYQERKLNIELHEEIAILLEQGKFGRSIAKELTVSPNNMMEARRQQCASG